MFFVCCQPLESERFAPPHVESASCLVEGRDAVVLRCTLSDSRVERCGFSYGTGEKQNIVECTLDGASFDLRLDDLVRGVVYTWHAFAGAGSSEIRSEEGTFRLAADYDPIPIEDPAFRAWLVSNFDTDGNGQISYAEAERITQIWIWKSEEYNIQSLQGIEFMPRLTHLCCSGSWKDPLYEDLPEHYFIGRRAIEGNHTSGAIGTLKRADVSHNPKLVYLNLSHNEGLGETVGEIDLSNNPMLKEVELAFSSLKFPKISHLANLKRFVTKGCYGEAPDFSVFSALEHLEIYDPLEDFDFDVDVSNCQDLETLVVSNTKGLVSGLSQNRGLKRIELFTWKDIYNKANSEELCSVLSELTKLEYLNCESIGIDLIDFSQNPRLKALRIRGNNLNEIDLTSNTQLEHLDCSYNKLESLDVSRNLHLGETSAGGLWCVQQQDSFGKNCLRTLYIAAGQLIPYVTAYRDISHIPEETEIVELSPYSLGEIIESGSTGIVAAVSDGGSQVLLMSVDEIHNWPWQESWDWCEQHGSGWIMPTIDELTAIYPNFYYLNEILRAAGYTPLTEENKCYWSCTPSEREPGYYYRERLWDGGIWSFGYDEWRGSHANYTRAVKVVSL